MSRTHRIGRSNSDVGLTAQVYSFLRHAINTGGLRPGERVVAGELARRFGVSKSPGREALKVLQHEGLIEAIPRRGYVVTPITVKQVQDVLDLRLVLERETAARAANRANAEQVDELQRLVGDPYVPGKPETYARFLAENKAFHIGVARLAGNDRLLTILDRLLDELQRLFHLGLDVRDRSESLVHEHERLVAAIRAGDPAEASRVMEKQIEHSRQMIIEAILGGTLTVNDGVPEIALPPKG